MKKDKSKSSEELLEAYFDAQGIAKRRRPELAAKIDVVTSITTPKKSKALLNMYLETVLIKEAVPEYAADIEAFIEKKREERRDKMLKMGLSELLEHPSFK